jgi:asparagine synthetase B (glutamine-hydrolysing)
MCGIGGTMRSDAAAYDHQQLVKELRRNLDHRGPDGRDDWQETKPRSVSLVHTNLAMQSSCGRYVLIYS